MYRDAKSWELYIGGRLKSARIRENYTQSEVAARAGLSLDTISRLETGKGSSLETFIKVLMVLGKEQWLEQLSPSVDFSPIDQFQLKKQRERVRKKNRADSNQ